MARARVPAAMPYVGSVSCWLSPLLREYSGLTLYLKNQHFQIQTRPGMVEEEPLGGCATSKSLFIYLFFFNVFPGNIQIGALLRYAGLTTPK